MTSAGLAWSSAAIAGRAMFAIAVSSDAIASAVKIAAAAHLRRSAARLLIAIGAFAEIVSVDIAGLSNMPDVARARSANRLLSACRICVGLNVLRIEKARSGSLQGEVNFVRPNLVGRDRPQLTSRS